MKVNIQPVCVYVKTCCEEADILLIFIFARSRSRGRRRREGTRSEASVRARQRRRTLNSRAAWLNPRLKELNPTNISSELSLDRRRRSAVPESRFISARISKFFSSLAGTRSLPRRLHKRVLRIAFLICR